MAEPLRRVLVSPTPRRRAGPAGRPWAGANAPSDGQAGRPPQPVVELRRREKGRRVHGRRELCVQWRRAAVPVARIPLARVSGRAEGRSSSPLATLPRGRRRTVLRHFPQRPQAVDLFAVLAADDVVPVLVRAVEQHPAHAALDSLAWPREDRTPLTVGARAPAGVSETAKAAEGQPERRSPGGAAERPARRRRIVSDGEKSHVHGRALFLVLGEVHTPPEGCRPDHRACPPDCSLRFGPRQPGELADLAFQGRKKLAEGFAEVQVPPHDLVHVTPTAPVERDGRQDRAEDVPKGHGGPPGQGAQPGTLAPPFRSIDCPGEAAHMREEVRGPALQSAMEPQADSGRGARQAAAAGADPLL